MEADLDLVVHRQQVFCKTIVSHFMEKLQKYKNLMLKHGINISDRDCQSTLHQSKSFEDDIELVLQEASSSIWSCRSVWKIGSRLSTVKVFQWVYQLVQRTKAGRILSHVNDVPSEEVRVTLDEVAGEMGTAYEQQLMLLYGDTEVVRLAQHAVACMVAYLNTGDASFTSAHLIMAVLEVKPQTGQTKETVRTRLIQYGCQPVCFRWYLRQILKQTGLRVEIPAAKDSPDLSYMPSENDHLLNNSDCSSNKIHQVRNSNESLGSLVSANSSQRSSQGSLNISSQYSSHAENLPPQVSDHTDGTLYPSTTNIGAPEESDNNAVTDKLNNDCTAELQLSNAGSRDTTVEAGNRENGVSEYSDEFENKSDSDVRSTHTDELGTDMDNLPTVVKHATGVFAEIGDNADKSDSCNMLVNNVEDESMKEGSIGGLYCNSEDGSNIASEAPSKDKHDCRSVEELENDDNCLQNKGTIITDFIDFDDRIRIIDQKNHKNNNCAELPSESIDSNNVESGTKTSPVNQGMTLEMDEDNNTDNEQVANLRTISAIDMDFENGKMHITEHIVEFFPDSGSIEMTDNNSTSTVDNCYTDANLSSPLSERLADVLDKTSIHVAAIGDGDALENKSEMMLDAVDATADQGNAPQKVFKFYGCFTPYGAKCCPHIYGFRGPLHVWDEKVGKYNLVYNDLVTVNKAHRRELPLQPDNPLQAYVPKTSCRH